MPGWTSFNNLAANLPAVMAEESVNAFADALNNNSSLSFDYAVGIMK